MSRDLPPLNALRAFEATARLSSVSLAAEQLHVTHGAVSRQLKVLEEHLGVSLFVKEGRGLKLTEAGIRLRDASGEAFERLRNVCAELTQSQVDAPFVLGCSGSLLARWFIPRLGRLNADLPDLRLHLSAGEGDLDPRRPGLDALLVFAEPPWPADMQVYELASERIGPVVSPRYAHYEQLRNAPAVPCLANPCCTPRHGRRHGRAGRKKTQSRRRICNTDRGLSTCTTCLKPPLRGWVWRLPPSRWWPRTCKPDAWLHPGASRKPRRS